MPGLSFQKIIAFCELLSARLKPQLETLPHLREETEGLDELIGELKELDTEQQALKGRLQEIIHQRQDAERRGQELRSRIVAQIQGKLGFTNENLHAYGITPRKTTRRRAARPEESSAASQAADEKAPSTTPAT
jgi:hypothetical protein